MCKQSAINALIQAINDSNRVLSCVKRYGESEHSLACNKLAMEGVLTRVIFKLEVEKSVTTKQVCAIFCDRQKYTIHSAHIVNTYQLHSCVSETVATLTFIRNQIEG